MNLKTNKDNSKISFQTNHEKSFLDNIVFEDFSFFNCDTRRVLEEGYFDLTFCDKSIKMDAAIDKARGSTGAKEAYGNHGCRLKGAYHGRLLTTNACVDIPLYVDKEIFDPKQKNMGRYKYSEGKPIFDAILAFGAYGIKELRNYYYDQIDENKQAIADKADEFSELSKSEQKNYLKKGKEMLKEK